MSTAFEIALALLLAIGSFFILLGSFSLLKLSSFFKRLHGPTKASTLGVGCVLVASVGYHFFLGEDPQPRELLITAFLFLTAPISAHFIAKAHLHEHVELRDGLPPTGRPQGWSTFESLPDPDADEEGDEEGDGDDARAAHH